jgi:hypothetical protein
MLSKHTFRYEFNTQKRRQKANINIISASLIEIKNPDYANNQGFPKKNYKNKLYLFFK